MIETLAHRVAKDVSEKTIYEAIDVFREAGLIGIGIEKVALEDAVIIVRSVAYENLESALFLALSIPLTNFLHPAIYSSSLCPGGRIIPFADISNFVVFFGAEDEEKENEKEKEKEKDDRRIYYFIVEKEKLKLERIRSIAFPLFRVDKIPDFSQCERADKLLSFQHILILAAVLGAVQKLHDLSLSYSNERKQGGKPISQYYAIREKILAMRSFCETYSLALGGILKQEKSFKTVSLCLGYALDSSCLLASEAIQIHGGYGYMKEFRVERIFRELLALSSLFSFWKTWAKIF